VQNLLTKIVTTVLGVALMLGWWTLRDKMGCNGDSSSSTVKKIPSKVWDGGGGTLTIEAEASEPASVVASFETNDSVEEKDHKFLEAWEQIQAGQHVFTVEVPANVGGHISVLFPDPKVAKVGSKLSVRVSVNGKLLGEDVQTLDKPLPEGYGMQAEVSSSDFASGKTEPSE
jgi:hypothetical protein